MTISDEAMAQIRRALIWGAVAFLIIWTIVITIG